MPHLSIQAPDFHQVADANLRHCTAFLGLLLTSSARLNCHTALSASIEPGIIWEYPGPFPVTRLRYSFFASVGLHLHATKRHYFLLCIYFWNTPSSFFDGLILYIGVLMLSVDYGIRWWNTVVYFRFIVTANLSPFSGTSYFGADIMYVKITSWDVLSASHKYISPLLCQVSGFLHLTLWWVLWIFISSSLRLVDMSLLLMHTALDCLWIANCMVFTHTHDEEIPFYR